MINIGTARQRYAPFGLGALVIGIFLLWRWKATDRGAEMIDRLTHKLPRVGDIWMKVSRRNVSADALHPADREECRWYHRLKNRWGFDDQPQDPERHQSRRGPRKEGQGLARSR